MSNLTHITLDESGQVVKVAKELRMEGEFKIFWNGQFVGTTDKIVAEIPVDLNPDNGKLAGAV